MKTILPSQIKDNVFKAVNDDWMLITAVNSEGKINTMTASWGGFGIMWGKPVCVCVIRPQRYTNEFVLDSSFLTLSFLEDGNREALKICGTKSGRKCDKIAESGLKPIVKDGYAYFEQSRLVLYGRKIYSSVIKEECFIDKSIPEKVYPEKDFHYVYVCEIEKVEAKE